MDRMEPAYNRASVYDTILVKGKDGDKTGVSRLGVGVEEYGI